MAVKPAPTDWWRVLIGAGAALMASAVGSAIGIIVTTAKLEVRVSSVEADHNALQRVVTELDQKGSRSLPVLEQKLAIIEARSNQNTPIFERLVVQVAAFESRIKLLEDTVNNRTKMIEEIINSSRTLTPLQLQVVENLRADIKRLDERQDRIVQALDQTYNLIQEHLRDQQQQKKQDLRVKP